MPSLTAALAAFDAMGAHGFAERARRELQTTGETVRKRAADVRDALTPQEAQIARLAATRKSDSELGAQSSTSAIARSSGICGRR